jgi:hypothetical protein
MLLEQQPVLAIPRGTEHPVGMPREREYRMPLKQLEHESRVPPEDQVEVVESAEVPLPDPRGAQPDRDWFAAGG